MRSRATGRKSEVLKSELHGDFLKHATWWLETAICSTLLGIREMCKKKNVDEGNEGCFGQGL